MDDNIVDRRKNVRSAEELKKDYMTLTYSDEREVELKEEAAKGGITLDKLIEEYVCKFLEQQLEERGGTKDG